MTLQEKVLEVLKDKKADPHPFILCIAAPPGCGKSAMIREFGNRQVFDPDRTVVISADLLRNDPDYEAQIKKRIWHPERLPPLVKRYNALAREIVSEAGKRKISVILEAHPDDYQHLADAILRITPINMGHKYEKVLIGMIPSQSLYLMRSRKQQIRGEKVDHMRRLDLLDSMSKHWDNLIQLFDHSSLLYCDYKAPPVCVAQWSRGKLQGEVFDPGIYNDFRDFAQSTTPLSIKKLKPVPPQDVSASPAGSGGGETSRWRQMAIASCSKNLGREY